MEKSDQTDLGQARIQFKQKFFQKYLQFLKPFLFF